MFVDASALVAILCQEGAHVRLVDSIDKTPRRKMTSSLAIFETVAALSRKRGLTPESAEAELRLFLSVSGIDIVPIWDAEGRAALEAFARFGKGRGHPAQLNLGDCFAYACARTHDVPLLFVGDGFSQTDIRPALA